MLFHGTDTAFLMLFMVLDGLARPGIDYRSARFLSRSQEADGLHIERLQTCQQPLARGCEEQHGVDISLRS